jgi:hypothetical protein
VSWSQPFVLGAQSGGLPLTLIGSVRPGGRPNASSAPRSRCLRHSKVNDRISLHRMVSLPRPQDSRTTGEILPDAMLTPMVAHIARAGWRWLTQAFHPVGVMITSPSAIA